jgi:mono/diheme cytochrome c family protein
MRPGPPNVSRNHAFLCLLAFLTLQAGVWAAAKPARGAKTRSTPVYQQDVQPLLDKYCYSCHGNGKKKGELALDAYAESAVAITNRVLWEKVMHQMNTREMPPANKPQPTVEEREAISKWVELEVFKCDCNQPDPGRVTIRRLNRTEYNNTIRDLTGIKFQPADDFPADDVGYGFDNIGDVLSLPPILLEKYLSAADKILTAAIALDDPARERTRRFPGDALENTAGGGPFGGGWTMLGREGDVSTNLVFRADGEYILRVRAYGQQAGPEPARMAIRVGTNELKRFDVTVEEKDPKIFEVRGKIHAGTNRVIATYLNNYRNPQDPDPTKRDRNLLVEYIEVEGPIGVKPAPVTVSESRRRIFIRQPSGGNKTSAAREVIRNFAKRAFRRPVTSVEVDRLMKLYALGEKQGENFEQSVRVALQAVLVSPHFLFRGELQPEPDNPRSVHLVNEFALASRLSYFLWSTMPDDELFALAEKGRLRKNLDGQIKRMLQDTRSKALVDNFAGQWLQTRILNQVAPDLEMFPEFDAKLATAMRMETELFFQSIMREDRSLLDLIDADYSFVNGRLAELYGLPGITGEEFQRVSLKGTPRGGLLTQASILTITSNPTRTSPVKRGKWILENILATPPPPAPPDVPELDAAKGKQLTGTLRQRMEQHRADPNCANCHARMDPLGFGFENFDAIGAWRRKDGDSPVDPAGQLATGESFQGPAELKKILMGAKRPEFVRCVADRMLTYALGRGLEYFDKCALDEVTKDLATKNYRFSALVSGIVKSVPFQSRRGEGDRFATAAGK